MDELIQKLETWKHERERFISEDAEMLDLDKRLKHEMKMLGHKEIFMTTTGKVYLTMKEFLRYHSPNDLSITSIYKSNKRIRSDVLLE